MRLAGTKLAANHQYRGFGDQLYDLSGQRPSLDLNFSSTKSLVDATTGQNLVTFTRASSGTYVDSQGVIRTATTNEARFDHNPTTGESLGLLVEESRTNLLLQSNGFDTTWINSNSSETAAAGIAPDGTNAAWELKDTLDASPVAHSLNQTITSFTSGTVYTFSVWMKAGTLSEGGIALPSASFGAVLINRINLATGTVITSSANLTTSVVLFPNGWRRIIASATATATASGSVQVRSMNGGTTYTGTGTGTVLVWGAQVEAGAFPTSYIPTTTATATRSADVASITGTNFSSWYRQDEGTVFYDGQVSGSESGNKNILGMSSGSGNNIIDLFIPSGINQRFRVSEGGVTQALQNAIPTASVYSPAKVAYAFKLDDSTSAGNGTVQSTDTSCTIPTVDRFTFGALATGEAQVAARFKRLTYWPKRLSNTTLQQITQ